MVLEPSRRTTQFRLKCAEPVRGTVLLRDTLTVGDRFDWPDWANGHGRLRVLRPQGHLSACAHSCEIEVEFSTAGYSTGIGVFCSRSQRPSQPPSSARFHNSESHELAQYDTRNRMEVRVLKRTWGVMAGRPAKAVAAAPTHTPRAGPRARGPFFFTRGPSQRGQSPYPRRP